MTRRSLLIITGALGFGLSAPGRRDIAGGDRAGRSAASVIDTFVDGEEVRAAARGRGARGGNARRARLRRIVSRPPARGRRASAGRSCRRPRRRSGAGRAPSASALPADTSAYSSYLRGLTLRFQFRFVESRDTFASLVDRKPLYVPALYGLAHAYAFTTLNDLTPPEEGWPRIDALSRRALALDSTAAGAWLTLAAGDMYDRRDLRRAGDRLLHARMLDSLEPDVPAMRSIWFRFSGRLDSSVVEARTAYRLDPLSVYFGRLVGRQLFLARRYDEARAAFGRILQDDPGWKRGYSDMAILYRAMGHPREAVDWLRRTLAGAGDSAGAAALPAPASDAAALRLLAADARRTVARLDSAARAGDRVVPSNYALAYAGLSDTLHTLQWLDSMSVHNGSYCHQIRLDPAFDFLRSVPRYQAWERGLGLPAMTR